MATVLIAPQALQQFNQGGIPLAGGLLYTYISGTTTKLATYTDYTGNTPNTNPIILDVNGQAQVWLQAGLTYTFVLSPSTDTDPPTNPFWTANGITGIANSTSSSGNSGAAVVLQTGDVKPFSYATGNLQPGWLVCAGQPVSRTTYATLFAAIGTTWGAGDMSTTFNLPDLRGRSLVGADNMGGTFANRITSTGSVGVSPVLGNAAGSQLAQADTLTTTDPGHTHGTSPGSPGVLFGSGSFAATSQAIYNFGAMTISTATTGVAVFSNLAGNQQNIPPVAFGNWAIWSGANIYNSANPVGVTTMVSAATMTPNFSQTNMVAVTLTAGSGTMTIAAPTGMVAGGEYSTVVNVTTTTAPTVVYGSGWKFFPPFSNASPPTISTGANVITIYSQDGTTALGILHEGPAA